MTTVMLLIDADNVSVDVMEQTVAHLLASHGALHLRRAYCTAESAVKEQANFKRLSIKPMVNLAAGKNSTDIALAVDAIDLVLAERPDIVAIASSDSDFAPLVGRLREKGCRVVGYGQDGKTGDETRAVYDDYTVFAHRAATARRTAVKTAARKTATKKAAAKTATAKAPAARKAAAKKTAAARTAEGDAPATDIVAADGAAKAQPARKAATKRSAARGAATAAQRAAAAPADGSPAVARRGAERSSAERRSGAERSAAERPSAERSAAARTAAPSRADDAEALPEVRQTPDGVADPAATAAGQPRPGAAASRDAGASDVRIARILDVLQELNDGRTLELGVASKRLRDAGLLTGRSSTKLFASFGDRFELVPAQQPNKVRLRGG